MMLLCQLLCMFNNIVAVTKIAVLTKTITVPQKKPTLPYSNPSNPGSPALSLQTSRASLQHTPWYNFQIHKNLQKHIHLCAAPLKCSVPVPGVLPKPQIAQPPTQIVFPGLNNTPSPNTSVIPAQCLETPDSPHKIVPVLQNPSVMHAKS
jgi:hypothetical protein